MKYKDVVTKAKIPGLVVSSMLIGGLGSAYLWNGIAHGDWDPTQLTAQVQQNTQQLQNHETRITNLETQSGITPSPVASPSPISGTNTAPTVLGSSTQPTNTPQSTPVATSTPIPTPTPIVATSYQKGYHCDKTVYYRINYSDNSYQDVDNPPSGVPFDPRDTLVCIQ